MERLHYLLALVLLPLFAAQAEKGETWDDGYRAYQDVAPEYLEITVSKVELKDGGSLFGSNSNVQVQAAVSQVFRSASGLRQGRNIVIAYSRKSQAGPLSLQPSVPKEGQTVPAFLRKKGDVYVPAALHHSFEPLTSHQLLILSENTKNRPTVTTTPVVERPEPPKPEPMAPRALIVTAPQPEPAAEDTPTPKPVPTPAPEPKKAVAKTTPKPKVTEPIIITEQEKSTTETPVIAEPLPARKPEPHPTPAVVVAKAEPVAPAPEPIVIQKIDPTPTPKPTVTAKVTPKPEKPAPALLSVSESPAATAPLAPSSPQLDQEGLTAYSAIYAKIKEGDKAADNNEKDSALKIYKDTLLDLERLKVSKPDFQPFIVEYRQKDLARKISALEAEPAKK